MRIAACIAMAPCLGVWPGVSAGQESEHASCRYGDCRSAYVLVDDDRITIRRVEYDIEREVTALFEMQYPHAAWLADMLRKGTYVPPPD